MNKIIHYLLIQNQYLITFMATTAEEAHISDIKGIQTVQTVWIFFEKHDNSHF